MKFKKNSKVRFVDDKKIYIVVHAYKGTDDVYKYDLISYDGKIRIESISEDCLESANLQ